MRSPRYSHKLPLCLERVPWLIFSTYYDDKLANSSLIIFRRLGKICIINQNTSVNLSLITDCKNFTLQGTEASDKIEVTEEDRLFGENLTYLKIFLRSENPNDRDQVCFVCQSPFFIRIKHTNKSYCVGNFCPSKCPGKLSMREYFETYRGMLIKVREV